MLTWKKLKKLVMLVCKMLTEEKVLILERCSVCEKIFWDGRWQTLYDIKPEVEKRINKSKDCYGFKFKKCPDCEKEQK